MRIKETYEGKLKPEKPIKFKKELMYQAERVIGLIFELEKELRKKCVFIIVHAETQDQLDEFIATFEYKIYHARFGEYFTFVDWDPSVYTEKLVNNYFIYYKTTYISLDFEPTIYAKGYFDSVGFYVIDKCFNQAPIGISLRIDK